MDDSPQLPTPGEAEGDRATVEADLRDQAAAPHKRPATSTPADTATEAPTLPNPSQAEGEDT